LIKGQRYWFPTIDGDARSGKPCCDGCYRKEIIPLIEKKNLDLGNLCEKCASGFPGTKRKRGGKHVIHDENFDDDVWECEKCNKKVRRRRSYVKECKEKGKPMPRINKKRKY